jgi:predicted AlkP superfamily phosphohydrolase/phosphomutase
MQVIAKQFENARQVWLIAIGGLSFDVLKRFADQGIMPNMARILPTLTRAELRQPFISSPSSSWATLESGQDMASHGVLDDVFLDRSRLFPSKTTFREDICENTDVRQSPSSIVWHRKPADEGELENGLLRTTNLLDEQFTEFRSAIAACRKRLMMLKLTVFDSLFLRLWHLLGITAGPAGRRSWIDKTQAVFRTLDEHLGAIFDFAAKDGAAIVLLCPYGFVPFREKIVINELLRRKGLFHPAEGAAYLKYASSRFLEKQKRRFGFSIREDQPLAGLLSVDWQRTRAVSLHGENAAFVYLNTPERFGGGKSMSSKQREETSAEVIAALFDARHSISGERLFQEAFSTGERFGIDPLEKRWPEVIGIPAPGYQIRQRLDRARQLVRPDPSVAAARTGEGFFCCHAPGVVAGEFESIDLSEISRVGQA